MAVANKPRELTMPPTLPGGAPNHEEETSLGTIGSFLKENFRHFNAGTLVDAADAYCKLMDSGGKMFLAMAGAMSTGELGISLAKMIRAGKVHAI